MSEKEKVIFQVLTDLVQGNLIDPVMAEEFWERKTNV